MNENKTNINWYPGHMAKAKNLIKNEMKNIDIVFEMVDARIPYSSKIKEINDIIGNKKKILIMTKKDLCDMDITNKWVNYYEKLNYLVLVVDLQNSNDYKKIISLTEDITNDIQKKRIQNGMKEKEIRGVVLGIPNVGKSTLINKLAGKNVTESYNKPGVTKEIHYLKTKYNMSILDTPGILWPKLDEENVSYNLASIGSIKKELLNIEDIGNYILNKLIKNYPKILLERFNINSKDINEVYELLSKKFGSFKNNEIDYEKVSDRIYNDLISGKIKGITLDEFK